MRRPFLILSTIAFLCVHTAPAQKQSLSSPQLNAAQNPTSSILPSNSISHIDTRGTTLWIGTSDGLARSSNGGLTWESFSTVPQFANPSVFAIALHGDTVWCATGYNKEVDNQSVQTGSGYAYSLDDGATWSSSPQPLDDPADSVVNYGNNQVHFLPIVVNEQNVTFDAAFTDDAVWVTSWSSGLRKSTDFGHTWQRIVLPSSVRNSIAPTDSLGFYRIDPRRDNNFLLFSVYAENNSTIWAGSAGGINKSTDGGASWARLSIDNQIAHLLGNWVIAIRGQRLGTTTRIWTTNWPAEDPREQYGVSYTDDGGRTWTNVLHSIKAYDFVFKDSIAYVATEQGLFRTADGGKSWTRSGSIVDARTGARVTSDPIYALGVIADTLYAGSGDGLASTIDNATHPFGASWHVARAYQPVTSTSEVYAYPNPFSPSSSQKEVTRFHYALSTPVSVTVEIFDFGMNRVRTVVKDVLQKAGEHDEVFWDGRGEGNKALPNGVYFYRVTPGSNDPLWGKIMILQ